MVRTQISLSELQHETARLLAAKLDVSMSEVFRRVLERYASDIEPPRSANEGLLRIAGKGVARADAAGDEWVDHDEAFVRSVEERKPGRR